MRNKKRLHCHMCGSERYATTKKDKGGNRVTRCCERPFVRVNGGLYEKLEDAPEWRILSRFVDLKRERGLDYEIQFGDTSYRKFVNAAHTLYKRCGFDVDLALEVLDVSFRHKRHRWRDHLDFFSVVSARFLPDALAIAKRKLAERRKSDALQKELVSGHVAPEWNAAYAQAVAAAL